MDVVGVSTDTAETNEKFRKSLDLPFPLVGDAEGRIVKAYGVRWPVLGIARRISFIVGRDRRIESVHRSELDATSHVEAACAVAGGTVSGG